MNDLEIRQWDKRLMDQARQGWENYKHLHIDLGTARADQSYLIAGEYLYVEQSSSADAIAKIKLNRNSNDALDLEKGVKIETVFIEIFITNDALQGEWLDLVFGINFKYKKKIALDYIWRGDPAVPDFTIVDFTTDGLWHILDLSAIVPLGVRLVHFNLLLNAAAGNQTFSIMRNGQAFNNNASTTVAQAVGLTIGQDGWVQPDENGLITYMGLAGPWNGIELTVRGWFI